MAPTAHRLRTAWTILLVAALAAAMIVVPGSPARADAEYCELSITPGGPATGGGYWVRVDGHAHFSNGTPADYLIFTYVYGDDSFSDDDLFRMSALRTSTADGGFFDVHWVPSSWLNEDWGGDEIYALCSVEPITGAVRSFFTNVVHGNY